MNLDLRRGVPDVKMIAFPGALEDASRLLPPEEFSSLFAACTRDSYWGRIDWQVYEERGSSTDFAFHFDMAAMLLDNLVDNHQAEPGTLTFLTFVFGGIKRIEDV